jgi:hypothetical protein
MKKALGRPRKIGVDRNESGRIRYTKQDNEPRLPRNGPVLSREETWLRSKLSPQALEAARWYAEWIKHRNLWLGYDEWRLPGCDLTVSKRLGRKAFTALVMTGERCDAGRPGLSNDGPAWDDRQSFQLEETSKLPLTAQFAPTAERPRVRDEVAADLQSNEAWQLERRRREDDSIRRIEYRNKGLVPRRIPEGVRGENVLDRNGKPYKFGTREMMGRSENGPFPPRRPFKPPLGPVSTDSDERCPGCTGNCKLQSAGNDPCAWRERLLADHMTLERILKMRFGSGDLRRRRWLVDHFALDGQFPAPSRICEHPQIRCGN